jgi:beta-lactamase class A
MRTLLLPVMLSMALAFSPEVAARQENSASADASAGTLQQDLGTKLSADLDRMASSYDGIMGICIKDLSSGQTFGVNADTVFPQASSIKIPILVELMRQAQAGKIDLAERVEIRRSGLVDGSGVLQFFSEGGSAICWRDLAVLMVALSDNSATNLIIERVGMENVNEMLGSLGLDKTVLARKMMDTASEQADRENRSTPRQMAALVDELNAGKLLDPAHTKMALEILEYPKDSPLRAGVPPEITIAEKPGSLNGAQCDAGVVFLPGRPYIISVMTTFNAAEGNSAITAVSARVFSYFNRLAHANSFGVRVR